MGEPWALTQVAKDGLKRKINILVLMGLTPLVNLC